MAKLKTTPTGGMIIEVNKSEGLKLAGVRPANPSVADVNKVLDMVPLKELAAKAVQLGEYPNPVKTLPETALGRTLEAALVIKYGETGLQKAGVAPNVVEQLLRTSDELSGRIGEPVKAVSELIRRTGLSIRHVDKSRTPEIEKLQDSIAFAKGLQAISSTASSMVSKGKTAAAVGKANQYLEEHGQLQYYDEQERSLGHLTPLQNYNYSSIILAARFNSTMASALGEYRGNPRKALDELSAFPNLAKTTGKPEEQLAAHKKYFKSQSESLLSAAEKKLPPLPPAVRHRPEGPGNVGL
ncbi:MAG: hypothetical protein PHG85_01570 [Candidatus Altiarchaeota archaeon]|nr:hypothetical protein [Candidatus Altiarchaeota archaeon]